MMLHLIYLPTFEDNNMLPELYSEQDVETKIIVPALEELGYSEHENSRVRLQFQYPIKAQQGRETKTIYADVVVFVDDTPVLIVDSKNPRQYLTENDREQVISYARLIGSVAPYAVLCNGHSWQIYDSINKQLISALPAYADLLADLQRRRLSDRQRQALVAQATRTLFAIESARELSRLMRRCHDVIRNLKGYDPTKAFDELSKLLFAKMYEEREVGEGRRTSNRFTSDAVKDMRSQGVEIIQTLWQDTVSSPQYREVFSDQDSISEIELPSEAVDRVVAILQDKSLGLTDLDVKGVAFEEFLAGTYRGGGLGQFFTPREVVSFMVDLVNPTIGERVIDPACGTGGFLIRTYDIVSEKIRNSDLSDDDKQERLTHLANSCLVGIDWESRAARTCKMNMIIHGDGHAGVYQANALDLEEVSQKIEQRQRFYPQAPSVDEGTFNIVLTNPPFGAKDTTRRILDNFDLGVGGSQKREVLMLERCIRLLKPNGRMAIVVPEGILSNKTDRHIREYLRKNCIIKAVIRLPQDTFQMSDGAANTSILFVIKRDPKKPRKTLQGDIFFARAEYIGISSSGAPIDQNDLPAIREQYRRFEQGEWTGIELQSFDDGGVSIIRASPNPDRRLWLEPEVNRTSLLYDRLSYVLRHPVIQDRFSYTYFHPHYYEVLQILEETNAPLVTLESLCVEGYPIRGKKPSEEVSEGIAILKVRNITGQGIDFDTEYAPDKPEVWAECQKAIVVQGDILITSTGEGTIGRINVYLPGDPAIADNHISICRLRQGIDRQYVVEFLRSEYGQIQMLRHVSGSTGQTELLIDHVKNLQIPMPDLDTRQTIVSTMQEAKTMSKDLLTKADKLRTESANTIAQGRQKMIDLVKGKRRDNLAEAGKLTREDFFETLRKVSRPDNSQPDRETSETSE